MLLIRSFPATTHFSPDGIRHTLRFIELGNEFVPQRNLLIELFFHLLVATRIALDRIDLAQRLRKFSGYLFLGPVRAIDRHFEQTMRIRKFEHVRAVFAEPLRESLTDRLKFLYLVAQAAHLLLKLRNGAIDRFDCFAGGFLFDLLGAIQARALIEPLQHHAALSTRWIKRVGRESPAKEHYPTRDRRFH